MRAPENGQHRENHARAHVFDVVRGFSVVSMVLFHFCYDIKFIAGLPLPWFAPPLQDIWRASISWTFVSLAGCMFAYSRDNLRRSLKYLGVALLVFVVTSIASVDTPINFGVIFCMGACTLICWALDAVGFRPKGPAAALALFICFIAIYELPRGGLGFGPWSVPAPRVWYSTPYFSWLGLPGPGFASGDYYPVLPFLFLYLAGSSMGRTLKERGLPDAVANISYAPLEAIGKLALPIYVLHQPALLALTELIVWLS